MSSPVAALCWLFSHAQNLKYRQLASAKRTTFFSLTLHEPCHRLRLTGRSLLDSKLVSIVNELESEAEQILQEARQQAAEVQREAQAARSRRAEQAREDAKREAERLVRSSRQKTEEDLERSRGEAKTALDALLHRAEVRLKEASRLILARLGKL
jgi:cell division septum initiation protein DivIVA